MLNTSWFYGHGTFTFLNHDLTNRQNTLQPFHQTTVQRIKIRFFCWHYFGRNTFLFFFFTKMKTQYCIYVLKNFTHVARLTQTTLLKRLWVHMPRKNVHNQKSSTLIYINVWGIHMDIIYINIMHNDFVCLQHFTGSTNRWKAKLSIYKYPTGARLCIHLHIYFGRTVLYAKCSAQMPTRRVKV